jgi:hypothetical protein
MKIQVFTFLSLICVLFSVNAMAEVRPACGTIAVYIAAGCKDVVALSDAQWLQCSSSALTNAASGEIVNVQTVGENSYVYQVRVAGVSYSVAIIETPTATNGEALCHIGKVTKLKQ